uniref:Uncharacterized protein n=1 Tax=Ditylenchus dipsaci TaxID=166011 RepID=A0A915EQ74_9BILA
MSEMTVAKTVDKLTSVWKMNESANIGKKKEGTKNPIRKIEDVRKRRDLYMEIFSEPNDVLKQAFVELLNGFFVLFKTLWQSARMVMQLPTSHS